MINTLRKSKSKPQFMERIMPYTGMANTVVLKRSKRKRLLKAIAIICGVFIFLFIALSVVIQIKKDEILSSINKEISEKIQGKVQIGKMDVSLLRHFPSISVFMENVSVGDSLVQYHHQPLLQMKEITVDIKWAALFNAKDKVKRITATEGKVVIFTDTSGYSNKYIFKNEPSKKNNSGSIMPDIVLEKVEFLMYDLIKEKKQHHRITHFELSENSAGSFEANMDIQVLAMIFNVNKGSFLKNKNLKGKFSFNKNEEGIFSFKNIRLNIQKHPFYLTGKFLTKRDRQPFELKVSADKILYNEIRSLLPEKVSASLAIADADQPMNVKAEIFGTLKSGRPLVNVSWDAQNTNLKTPLQNFDSASFSGTYTNELTKGLPRNDPNSRIVISNFKAIWKGMPVESKKMEILDLKNPILTCDIFSNFPLSQLNGSAGIQSFNFLKGSCAIQVGYSGPLVNNNNENSIVNGSVHFDDGQMLYVPRNVLIQNFNGDILIKNSDVSLHQLKIKLLDQQINIDGNAKNLISMMNTDPGNAVIDFLITTTSLDLKKFTYFFESRKAVKAKNKSINSLLSQIDDVLEKGKLNIRLLANSIHYKNFDASDVQADFSLLTDKYIVREIKMKHAGGDMMVNGDLTSTGKNFNAALQFNMKNMQVTRLFNSFDNFGQDAITSRNLEGKLTVKAKTTLMLDDKGSIVPSSINSKINFLLQNGLLQNFEPVKKMQKFVFKNRNFDTIRFADIQNVLEIRQKKIYINRMEIRSSVLAMYVQGIYANDGSTDLSIQLPLSNLVKNKNQLNLINLGNQKSGGSSVFLRGRPGQDGNIEFKLDLFNRYKRKVDR